MQDREFLDLISEVDEETVIGCDKTEKQDKIVKKEFKIDNELILGMNNIKPDVFFLSIIMFTLTKFTYSKEILITKLIKNIDNDINNNNNIDNEFIKTIIAKKINTNNAIKDYLNEIDQLISKNIEFKSYFTELSKTDDLIFPDFQYYYQKEDGIELNIPESNFTIIIKENIKKNGSKIQFVYNCACYSEKLIELFYNSLIIIVNKFINNQDILLKNISIAESHEIKFKKTGIKSLKEFFENIVKDNSDKIALFAPDKTLTYNELNQESNKIANSLIDNGLNIGDKVIINLNRDSNLISSIIAVLKVGGVFILTNPNNPIERNNYFKENSQAKIIIDQNNINTLIKNTNTNNPITDLNPNNLFTIVYTSGSTGKPKGVLLTHENIVNKLFYTDENILICAIINLDISAFLLSMNVLFVGFIVNLFVVLCAGRTIVLCDDEVNNNPLELYEIFKKTPFDLMATVPSLIEAYLKIEPLKELLNNLKMLCVLGEKSTKKFIESIKKHTTAKIYNIYGSTEVSGIANAKLLNDDINGTGKPQYNVDEKIMDIDGNPLPVSVIGELWIGGPGTSKGYINNQQLTEETFTEINDYTYFKSGDFAKFNEDAEVEVLGRVDNQIKINGQRIDPGEIENNIPEDIGIEKAIVLAKNNKNNDKILCLYFTTKSKSMSGNESNEIKDKIRNHLNNILPSYMIPNVYVHLDELPLNTTGKVDINKLPEPNFAHEDYIPPKNQLQIELVEMFSNVLGLDKNIISIDDDFFYLGGDSIKAINLANQINNQLNLSITTPIIFKYKTIKDISKQINESETDSFKQDKHKTNRIKHDKRKLYPLSPNQVDYLNLINNKNNDSSDVSNINFCVSFDVKRYDIHKLKDALIKTIDINSYMKTYATLKSNLRLYQKDNKDYEVNIKVHENALTEDIINDFFKEEFNLLKPLLFKFEFYSDAENIFLLMSIHHGIADFYSINLILEDLIRIYNGENLSKEYDYFDYILDYFENISKEDALKINRKQIVTMFKYELISIFKKKLSRVTKRSSKKIEKKRVKLFSFNIKTNENVINFCNKYDITESDFIFYILLMALKKFLDTDELLIDYAFNGRNNPKYMNTVGLFIKELWLYFKLKEDSIESSLKYIKEVLYSSMQNFNEFKQIESKQNIEIYYNYLANFLNKSNDFTIKDTYQKFEESKTKKNILQFYIGRDENNTLLVQLYYNSSYYNEKDLEKLSEYMNNFSNTIK
jgi:amino acid adenylation domain-containing protein